MPTAEPHVRTVHPTGDFAPNAPLLRRSLFAVVIGGMSTLGAQLLLGAISVLANIFYFGALSFKQPFPQRFHKGHGRATEDRRLSPG